MKQLLLLITFIGAMVANAGAAEILPSVQGYHSEKLRNVPTIAAQYPSWDGYLVSGVLGPQSTNLRMIIKYSLEEIPAEVHSARITLTALRTSPNPQDAISEALVPHYYILETFGEENAGPVTYEDAASTTPTQVGDLIVIPKLINARPADIDVTKAVQNAKKSGWKSIGFRVVETDPDGAVMTIPKNVMWGILFRGNPPLTVE